MKMPSMSLTNLFCLSAILLANTTAQAGQATTFTVNATADTSALGYTAGQAVTFTFATNPNLINVNYYSDATVKLWDKGIDQLVGYVSGTGLGGTFVRPNDGFNESIYLLNTGPLDNIYLNADATQSNIGLTTPAGVPVLYFDLNLTSVTNFTFGGAYTPPSAYFSPFTGSYHPGGYISIQDIDMNIAQFTPTSLTISTAVVPEPSSCVAFTGFIVLTFAGLRRRRSPVRTPTMCC